MSTDPKLIMLYKPNGEIDLLKGCTNVQTDSDHLLRFYDREGRLTITSLPFTLSHEPLDRDRVGRSVRPEELRRMMETPRVSPDNDDIPL